MKYSLLAAAAAVFIPSAGAAQTTMPLNTGYNYNVFGLYPAPTTSPSTVTDNYWIKITSFEPPSTNPPIAPAWVLDPAWAGWQTLPNSRWIGPQSTISGGTSGTSATNPAYYIYRKCFCLMPGYQNPTLTFQLRSDNEANAWLNSITNVLVPPSPSSFTGNPVASQPTTAAMFRPGLNCVYVLVQNTGGPTGFNLAGTVSATGLMPVAGAGANNSFAPCQCGATEKGLARADRGADADGQRDTVRAIVAFAEARRRQAGSQR